MLYSQLFCHLAGHIYGISRFLHNKSHIAVEVAIPAHSADKTFADLIACSEMSGIVITVDNKSAFLDQLLLHLAKWAVVVSIKMVIEGGLVGDKKLCSPLLCRAEHVGSSCHAHADLRHLASFVACLMGINSKARIRQEVLTDHVFHYFKCFHNKLLIILISSVYHNFSS